MSFQKQTIRDIDPRGKRILVRVDFNVPLKDDMVSDDTRLRAALPTLQNLLKRGGRLVLCSHLGRPKDQVVPALSLRPVAARLQELLGQPVGFVDDCIGEQAAGAAQALKPGELLLLENTRFYPQEKANDPAFAARLASYAEIFVNDAFGSAHRAHASTVGVAAHLPAVAGLLMEKELLYLGAALADPERPFVAILGGAKISDKIEVVERLLEKADRLLIGGGMANTFLAAGGLDLGDSLVEAEALDLARSLFDRGRAKIVLPLDAQIADAFAEDARRQTVAVNAVPAGWRVLDIGPRTAAAFSGEIQAARTVIWNGPMGVFELAPFAAGTEALARALAESPAVSIVCGGDSAAAVVQTGVEERITHVSTGGGASLEFLVGKRLPGVEALLDQGAQAG